MSTLERAIEIAVKAHKGQVDKGGNPYILHPLRVMINTYFEEEQIVAVLHDIVEDTEITLDDLRKEGFSEEIIEAIDYLTRRKEETYMDFIRRCKLNELATTVKIQDIHDNMDLSRIENPTKEDYRRLNKYEKALNVLCDLEGLNDYCLPKNLMLNSDGKICTIPSDSYIKQKTERLISEGYKTNEQEVREQIWTLLHKGRERLNDIGEKMDCIIGSVS